MMSFFKKTEFFIKTRHAQCNKIKNKLEVVSFLYEYSLQLYIKYYSNMQIDMVSFSLLLSSDAQNSYFYIS